MSKATMVKDLLIKCGYGNIACKLWGDTVTASERFLSVHGWLDNAGSFEPLMEYFMNKDRCVVAVDLPGHGLSSHFPQGIPYSPATDLQAMRSVIRHLGWKSYNLMGHSMGAMRCQAYSLCWPAEVKTVICLDGVMWPLDALVKGDETSHACTSRLMDKFLQFTESYHGKNREHTWAELSERWLAAVSGLRQEDFTILMKRGSAKLGEDRYVYTRDPALHHRMNVLLTYPMKVLFEEMKRLTNTHQLIIFSSDKMWSESSTLGGNVSFFLDGMKQSSPCKVDVIEFGGAHHFHMQQPSEISDLVNKWLASLDGHSSQPC